MRKDERPKKVTETSHQFHQYFTLAFFVRRFLQSQTLSREKLLKRLSYKKCARKHVGEIDTKSRQMLGERQEHLNLNLFSRSPCLWSNRTFLALGKTR